MLVEYLQYISLRYKETILCLPLYVKATSIHGKTLLRRKEGVGATPASFIRVSFAKRQYTDVQSKIFDVRLNRYEHGHFRNSYDSPGTDATVENPNNPIMPKSSIDGLSPLPLSKIKESRFVSSPPFIIPDDTAFETEAPLRPTIV